MIEFDRSMWPSDPKEMRRAIDNELEKLLVLGLIEIVGKDAQGNDLYVATEQGKNLVDNMRDFDFGQESEEST